MTDKYLANDDIEATILEHLGALLPGARLTGPYTDMAPPAYCVSYDTGHRLRIFLTPGLNRYYSFDRIIPFSNEERVFCEKVVQKIRQWPKVPDGELRDHLPADIIARVIAEYVAPDFAETLYRIMGIYQTWSRPYTGHTTFILPAKTRTGVNLFDMSDREMLNCWENGPGAIGINHQGRLIVAEGLTTGKANKTAQGLLSPIIWADIAEWSGSARKAAVRLNEDGRILIFGRRQLLFARLDGCWHSLPHTLIDLEMLPQSIDGVEPETVKAIYLTALDMAAGQDRAVIELFRPSSVCPGQLLTHLPEPPHSSLPTSDEPEFKADQPSFIAFPKMPRSTRLRLCVVNGSVFMDGQGEIIDYRCLGLLSSHDHRRRAEPGNCEQVLPGSGYMQLLNNGRGRRLFLNIHSGSVS